MFDLQEAQQKRIVGLAAAGLVFAFYAIYQLFDDIFNRTSDSVLFGDASLVFQLGCVVLMMLTITYLLLRSITDHRELVHRQLNDQKTGLPNRLALQRKIQETYAQFKKETRFALICVDIDRLKSVNESRGHESGDALILKVGERLKNLAHGRNQFFKMNGGQYVFVVKNIVDQDWIISFADEVFKEMSAPFQFDEGDLYVDVTIGACSVNAQKTSTDELFRRLEFALLQAKKNGGKCLIIYDEGVSKSVQEQSTLENQFRELLESNKLELVYQPLIDADANKIAGVEALARWNHAEQGYVSPNVFVPIASKLGLVNKLGRFVLDQACQAAVGLAGLKVAVNISPEHFLSSRFLEDVNSSLTNSGLRPNSLEIEITEDVLLRDSELAIERMNTLRSMGISIALDDFGAGYSGLSYLHKFEVDRLKIDAVFIRELENSLSSKIIVSTIIQLASSHNFEVTVEGVETKMQGEYLAQFGNLVHQGYLYSKPLSYVELLQSGLFEQYKSSLVEDRKVAAA